MFRICCRCNRCCSNGSCLNGNSSNGSCSSGNSSNKSCSNGSCSNGNYSNGCCFNRYCYNKNFCNGNNCMNCIYNRGMDEFDITMEQLWIMVAQGALLVDIRSPQEYNEGHLNNSIVLPEYEIRKKASSVIPNKNQQIIVYCDTGIRSKSSQRMFQKLGYTNVYNLYKGTENY